VASTARTYGEERMRALYGQMVPSPAERVRAVNDGDRIDLGDRALEVLHTPGHASHHVALLDTATGATCTGEAIGSYLPWADAYRPALPPPEVDVEAALASIERIRARGPSSLLTSHFGATPDVGRACARAAARIVAWSDEVARALRADADVTDDELTAILRLRAEREFAEDGAGASFDLDRYDALGSIRMNAQGLARYWRKRWQAETSAG
jgi:glyoxylase-like metal-dependent hydrolase (beta-lactamase superfamily II)